MSVLFAVLESFCGIFVGVEYVSGVICVENVVGPIC